MADRPSVAVLLPSRDRPASLARSVGSLLGLAADPAKVDIRVGADYGDYATYKACEDMGVHCMLFHRRGYEGLHEYYRQLAGGPDADWLLIWNDDAYMVSPRWDETLRNLPPSVLVADLQSRHTPICAFPAVRSGAPKIIGTFCSDNPHVDSFWEVIGQRSGTIGLADIHVHHDQQPHAHLGNDHGFSHPDHQKLLSDYARVIRTAMEAAE